MVGERPHAYRFDYILNISAWQSIVVVVVFLVISQARASAVPGTGGDDVRDDHLHCRDFAVCRRGKIERSASCLCSELRNAIKSISGLDRPAVSSLVSSPPPPPGKAGCCISGCILGTRAGGAIVCMYFTSYSYFYILEALTPQSTLAHRQNSRMESCLN